MFVVPLIVLLPLKFLEVYFLAKLNWLGAAGVLVLAKLMGLGVTAFMFDTTRDQLLQMAWFARICDWFLWATAHRQVSAPAHAAAQTRLSRPPGLEQMQRVWRPLANRGKRQTRRAK